MNGEKRWGGEEKKGGGRGFVRGSLLWLVTATSFGSIGGSESGSSTGLDHYYNSLGLVRDFTRLRYGNQGGHCPSELTKRNLNDHQLDRRQQFPNQLNRDRRECLSAWHGADGGGFVGTGPVGRRSLLWAMHRQFIKFFTIPQTVHFNGCGTQSSSQTENGVSGGEGGGRLHSGHWLHVVERLYTGRVYVAGVNRLYQLNSNLLLQSQVETGPARDGTICTDDPACDPRTRLSDNYNKALAIYHKQTKLIVCSSLYDGHCRLRNLYNISVVDDRVVDQNVVSGDLTASAVLFVNKGPNDEDVLYVGRTGKHGNSDRLTAVKTLSLNPDQLFNSVYKGVSSESSLVYYTDLEMHRVDYIYGFGSGNFSYFVTKQPKLPGGRTPYISKLVRLCNRDPHYYSYTEVPLECIDDNNGGVDYNLVQSAYLGKAGFDLARDLNINTEDDVLYVIFVRGVNEPVRAQMTRQSALCVYSMKAVEQRFLDNVQLCAQGVSMCGLAHQQRPCISTHYSMSALLCNNEVNHPLDGSLPVRQKPAFTTDDSRLTAVASTTTHMYTVLFLGTEDGQLKKVVVETATSAYQYDTFRVESGWPILPSIDFDMSNQFLYVLTNRSLSKVRVHECIRHERCQQCLNARDPYCGWGSLENKCSTQEDCKSSHWLPYKDSKCTSLTKVVPDKIQITTAKFLELTVQNFPAVSGQLSCVFTIGTKKLITGASGPIDQAISCPTPQTNLLPPIPRDQHELKALLSIQVDDGPDFAAINFTFYDCSNYRSCHDCVNSDFGCDWCAESAQCTASAAEQCRGQLLVNGMMSKTTTGRRRGAALFCPHIVAQDQRTILVPSGTVTAVTVRAVNLLDFQKEFTCEFSIGNAVHRRPASRLGDLIQCDQMEFSYFDPEPNVTAGFSVTWAPGKALDNVHNIGVVMYKCERLASNCGLCLHLPASYGCGWCTGGQQQSCTINSKCDVGGSGSQRRWLHHRDTCPNPTIVKFWPTAGPVDGGTRLTIEGVNLGRDYSEIENAVRIKNVVCTPIAELYEPSTRIVCVTGPAKHRKTQSGPVVVKIRDVMDYVAVSDQDFRYVVAEIGGFTPTSGPQSGGTVLTIRGNHLNAGSRITATVGGVPCHVLSLEPRRALCRTGASSLAGRTGGVEMRFDNAVATYASQQFTFEEDPAVLVVSPQRSIVSGGVEVDVRGERFHLVQRMTMHFTLQDRQTSRSECTILTADQALCRTPALGPLIDQHLYPQPDRPLLVDYGFSMDGVDSANNLSSKSGFRPFSVYPDPEFELFQSSTGGTTGTTLPVKYFKNDYLTINGNNIDLAVNERDVRIYVGAELCNLTALASRAVTCKPPDKQPPSALGQQQQQFHRPASTVVGNQQLSSLEIHRGSTSSTSTSMLANQRAAVVATLPEVVVSVGGRNYTIGYLSYDDPSSSETALFGSWPAKTVATVAAVLALFVGVVLVLLLLYRRKSTKQRRQMRSLKEQIDAIELKVANECKEAFAELQTDIATEWTADTTTKAGIPFLPYKDYVLQVLFPNSTGQASSFLRLEPDLAPRSDRRSRGAVEKGLLQFNQLLMNKTFLLTLVRVLESNKYFLSKDRVYVGSLLMVILHERMDYCTDILKTLLAALIERTVRSRHQPKILFRRSESVAERMLAAWFTFLMHKYLLDCAGQPLFTLYWAIKQQVEKGPQDATTFDARYSLSEEKLIRQTVDFHPLVVYVSNGFDSSPASSSSSAAAAAMVAATAVTATGSSEVAVRVLDCDTITQVKEKCLDAIYRTTPYSRRPSALELDLEWRTGVSGRLVLQDLDVTTKPEPGGWKRLNTLAHYKVPNNASLALVAKQSSMYNLSLLSERSDKSSTFSLKNSPTLARAFSPGKESSSDSGYKIYHLVKPHDHYYHHHHHHQADIGGVERVGGKMVSEIYLTRLLTTKGTLQKFVEDLFEAIFSTAHRGNTLPLCIKYMYDFMDDQAAQHGILDPEVVHTWKSNSLPLRFWVNLIKNPHFVFDIPRPAKIEGCLSVVAQTLMDSCSTQDPQLTKDSPSSKLLFARDIHSYREWVERYYMDVRDLPVISDQDMNAFLVEESRQQLTEFNVLGALQELYKYVNQYKDQLLAALEEDEFSRRNRLPAKFVQMQRIFDGEEQHHSMQQQQQQSTTALAAGSNMINTNNSNPYPANPYIVSPSTLKVINPSSASASSSNQHAGDNNVNNSTSNNGSQAFA
ncbi:Plexin-A4 [Trichinella murrelli]|uniref:Plexin-A4 n=1 Tax=Trichinella murrelli TaxID=144512 RepID=A0A0V0TXV7_9BILA|nr:Plexin-A4 [Trichinella murrelli]